MVLEPTNDSLRLPRSSHWPALRDQWLKDHPTCAACGCSKRLQVHHKIPVHVNRSLELTPANLITLCEHTEDPLTKPDSHCHLRFGHLGNWFNYNKNVELDTHKAMLARYDHRNQHAAPSATPAASDPTIDPPLAIPPASNDHELQLTGTGELLLAAASNPATPPAADLPTAPPDARRPHRFRPVCR